MIAPRLVVCSGAEVPNRSGLVRGRKIVGLDTISGRGNAYLKIENVSDQFATLLPPRLVDLLEIATYVYTADCEASRERAWMDDKATEPWSRDFCFVLPVRDLGFWERSDVTEALTDGLSFMSSDVFQFRFEELHKERPTRLYLDITDVVDLPFYDVNRVTMFSGGLDSLAGSAAATAAGERLVAVSHRPAPQINARQRQLFRLLHERYGTPMMHVPVWVNKHGFDQESTQRTRTFLFASLGAAVASYLRAGGVRFYENGVTSLNWPLAQEVVRSRASRSTHPEALQRLQTILRLVLERPDFVVDNPFVFRTKAELVASVAERGAADFIPKTCSCIHTMFQPRTQWHCGRCSQCIDRRIAILASGQAQHDTGDDYVTDVFTGPRKHGYDHNVAANYARFAGELHSKSEAEIATTYNLELVRAARCFDSVGEAAQEFVAMHERHAAAAYSTIAEQVSAYSGGFVAGTIDRSSLVGMVGGQEHFGRAVASTEEVESAPTTAPRQADQNMFRKGVGCWNVNFAGQAVVLADMVGARYIAFLLQHPDQEFDALALVRTVRGDPTPLPNRDYSQMSAEELEEETLRVGGFDDAGEVMDPAYEAECRNNLRAAQEELKRARTQPAAVDGEGGS